MELVELKDLHKSGDASDLALDIVAICLLLPPQKPSLQAIPFFAFHLDTIPDFVYAASLSGAQHVSSMVEDLIDIEESVFSRN